MPIKLGAQLARLRAVAELLVLVLSVTRIQTSLLTCADPRTTPADVQTVAAFSLHELPIRVLGQLEVQDMIRSAAVSSNEATTAHHTVHTQCCCAQAQCPVC